VWPVLAVNASKFVYWIVRNVNKVSGLTSASYFHNWQKVAWNTIADVGVLHSRKTQAYLDVVIGHMLYWAGIGEM